MRLQEDASEWATEDGLRKLIKRYSEFITFPIYLRVTKTETVQVPVEEDEEEATPTPAPGEEDEEVAAEAVEEKKPKTKSEQRETVTWELLNEQKALWQRKPKDVTDDEYVGFYKAITKDHQDPLTWIHFSAEGEVNS